MVEKGYRSNVRVLILQTVTIPQIPNPCVSAGGQGLAATEQDLPEQPSTCQSDHGRSSPS